MSMMRALLSVSKEKGPENNYSL